MTTAITAAPVVARLPSEPNSFVGRERDLADLAMLLADVRMLTLSGPGGVGKTRLATRLAGQLAGRFGDGAWLVELAEVSDPALVTVRVSALLGIREEPDRPLIETLADALRQRQLLIVLDTCEHLIEAVADIAHRLLTDCPQVRIMATSREPLHVRGETVWRVPPLAVPPAGPAAAQTLTELASSEAVRLFLDRAAAVRPGFALTTQNAETVYRICRTLDGMPLAIELAAARMRALSTEQIAERLDDRFRLLASSDRTAPPRQQTLRAAVDWSHDLLTQSEQILLRRLAVFSGWSLEMAEQVCADELIPAGHVLGLLAGLIDKSLVVRDGETHGLAHYRLLDTIRQYAADQLIASGEEPEIRQQHLRYMLARVEAIVERAFCRGDPPWPERVVMYQSAAAELPNFRAALATALETGQAELGLRLCSALRAPWVVYGDVTEGITWFDRFLRIASDVDPGIRAMALTRSAELAFEQQDYARTATASQAAADVYAAEALPGSACVLRLLGLVSLRAGQTDRALASVQAAIDAALADEDPWEEGLGLAARANVLARLGQPDEAGAAFTAALKVLEDNNGWGVAQVLYGFGSLARARRDNESALRHFRSALLLFEEIDARTEIARCLAGIGWVTLASGNLSTAAESLSQSLRLSMATGQRLGIARGLDAVAALAVAARDPATAVRLEGAAGALRDQVGPVRSAAAQVRLDDVLTLSRRQVGEQLAVRLLAEGARMSVHDAVGSAIGFAERLLEPEPDGDAGEPLSHPDRPDTQGAGMQNGDVHIPAASASGAARADGAGQARSLARSGGTTPGPSVLTPRELQIAGLIARGLSNRAIAAELVISPATAARHVANIFAKLGVSSRAQVAAWTAEHSRESRGM
jgi:predicted ATPase/DNA-binding CsgD family transcriptional regulator/Tfp pilus assembly protein PilF